MDPESSSGRRECGVCIAWILNQVQDDEGAGWHLSLPIVPFLLLVMLLFNDPLHSGRPIV